MITPCCSSAGGSGRIMPTGSIPAVSPFTAVESLPFSQMNPLTLTVPVPGTTDVPTSSGIVAATVPRPGTEALSPSPLSQLEQLNQSLEMIPGQPDAQFLPPQTPGFTLPETQTPGITTPETSLQTPVPPVAPAPPQTPPGSGVNPPPVLPTAPQFQVPANPLLPPGYQEFIDYENLQYLNGFLRTQIGKYMRVEQLVGASNLEDRYGYLVGVGINYILLQELGTRNILAIDYYGIKSVYVFFNQTLLPTGR